MRRSAIRRNAADQGSIRSAQPEGVGQRLIQILNRDPKAGMGGTTGGNDLVLHLQRYINRNGKRQTLVATRMGVNLGINAHHGTTAVKQRPAGVARVYRCIRLNKWNGGIAWQ